MYRLFTPGPVEISDDVKRALADDLVYHRDREFSKIFFDVSNRFKELLYTDGYIFFFASSGTGAMEAAVVNMFREGDTVLVLSTGKFGERWRDISRRFGLNVIYHEEPPGYPVDVENAQRLIMDNCIEGVLTTLTDTSTGVTNPIREIAKFTREKGIPLIVDAVSGFIADPLKMDDWGVDLVVGGSQKSLVCPPGIGFAAIMKDSWRFVERSNLPRYYWDFPTYRDFAEKGQTPYTPSIVIFYALRESLKCIDDAETMWRRYREVATLFRSRLDDIGIRIFPHKPSNALTIIDAKGKADDIIEYVLRNYNILFANGQKELKGKIVRISHMGHLSDEDVKLSFEALKKAWEEIKP